MDDSVFMARTYRLTGVNFRENAKHLRELER